MDLVMYNNGRNVPKGDVAENQLTCVSNDLSARRGNLIVRLQNIAALIYYEIATP